MWVYSLRIDAITWDEYDDVLSVEHLQVYSYRYVTVEFELYWLMFSLKLVWYKLIVHLHYSHLNQPLTLAPLLSA